MEKKLLHSMRLTPEHRKSIYRKNRKKRTFFLFRKNNKKGTGLCKSDALFLYSFRILLYGIVHRFLFSIYSKNIFPYTQSLR